jgi:hypothetical protein
LSADAFLHIHLGKSREQPHAELTVNSDRMLEQPKKHYIIPTLSLHNIVSSIDHSTQNVILPGVLDYR